MESNKRTTLHLLYILHRHKWNKNKRQQPKIKKYRRKNREIPISVLTALSNCITVLTQL